MSTNDTVAVLMPVDYNTLTTLTVNKIYRSKALGWKCCTATASYLYLIQCWNIAFENKDHLLASIDELTPTR